MRALALVICLPVLAIAQMRSGYPRGGSPPLVPRPAGALGGNFTTGSSRPLGGVELPGSGLRAAQAALQGHPVTPVPQRTGYGYGYVGPVYYTPNAADLESIYSEANSHLGGGAYHSAYPPAPVPPVMNPGSAGVQFSSAPPQPQTVIVNNYYGKDAAVPTVDSGGNHPEPPSDYYLIAYKNRNVIAALAYWLDGETLHYVTSEKAHNQASLALIDLDMTRRLNSDREVPFTVPAK